MKKFALKDQKQEETLSLNFHLKEASTVKGTAKLNLKQAASLSGNTFYQLSPDMRGDGRKAEGLEMMSEKDKRRTEVIPKVKVSMGRLGQNGNAKIRQKEVEDEEGLKQKAEGKRRRETESDYDAE